MGYTAAYFMRVLITGGKGQVARDCTRVLANEHHVSTVDKEQMDICDPKQIEESFTSVKPEIVLNCAALTAVDACESQTELAKQVNAEGPRFLAKQSKRIGAKLFHLSTDYVFDGAKTPPEAYVESDPPHPLSQYGKTKLTGEENVQRATDRHIILRTGWLYGIDGRNFLKTVLRLAQQGKAIRVVDDQYGAPTWSYRLALQIKRLIGTECNGIYHATAEGYATRYEVAKYFLEKMGLDSDLAPCTSTEYPTAATRPQNSILENRRLKDAHMNVMKPWQDDLDEFISLYRQQLLEENDT